jgi:hypothetical protein
VTNPEQISVNPELVTANLMEMLQQANLLVAQWKAATQEARHELALAQKKLGEAEKPSSNGVARTVSPETSA